MGQQTVKVLLLYSCIRNSLPRVCRGSAGKACMRPPSRWPSCCCCWTRTTPQGRSSALTTSRCAPRTSAGCRSAISEHIAPSCFHACLSSKEDMARHTSSSA